MDLSTIFESFYRNRYIETCEMVKKYYKDKTEPPASIKTEFDMAIADYRIALDKIGFKMPKQIFPYSINEPGTHKYVRLQVSSSKGVKMRKEILNPNYIYSRMTKNEKEIKRQKTR